MAIELKTTDSAGKPVGKVSLEEEAFGGFVKNKLIHAASVMYQANKRQGSACTKTRAEIAGSTKKLYRQKGTGRSRAGSKKSGIRKGGGVIHGPKPRSFRQAMPKKQRQAALRSALLGKAKDGEILVIEALEITEPKTKSMIALLEAHSLGTDTVLVATNGQNKNAYLSARNIPGVKVIPASDLNAQELLVHKHLLIEKAAFEQLSSKPTYGKHSRKPRGTRKPKPEAATQKAEG